MKRIFTRTRSKKIARSQKINVCGQTTPGIKSLLVYELLSWAYKRGDNMEVCTLISPRDYPPGTKDIEHIEHLPATSKYWTQ